MESNVLSPLVEPSVAQHDFYDSVKRKSPGSDEGELKDQDRVYLISSTDSESVQKQMAIVCDGISQSPHSAEAAELVSKSVLQLYKEKGIGEVVRTLIEKREAFINMPIKLNESDPLVLKKIFEEIVREKRSQSYQTTFISVCLEKNLSSSLGGLRVDILGCGDSAAFIFTKQGELLYNNLQLVNENTPLLHLSMVTEALPDSYDDSAGRFRMHSDIYQEDIEILLCSDGFYDSFATFNDMFSWLRENYAKLKQENATEEILLDLHSKLSNQKGDDDISFIWLFPQKAFETPAEINADSQLDGTTIHDESQRNADLNTSYMFRLRQWFREKNKRLRLKKARERLKSYH